MKKFLSLLLSVCMVLSMVGFAAAEGPYTPGTYTATAQGFGGAVTVTITVDAAAITDVIVDASSETPALGGAAASTLADQIKAANGAEIDGVAGASLTSNAAKEAAAKAIAAAKGEAAEAAPLAFTAGEYTASGKGYNGMSEFKVTFSDTAIVAIEVVKSTETAHVGDVAFAPMIEDMIACNGSGVDAVSGATFSSNALRSAVNDAAAQAGCTNMDAFQSGKVAHEAKAPIEETYDVVVIGAGGAGMGAAAQAVQDGNTVLIIEKNAEVGGNTLVSGGQFQSVMPYLVWDPTDPDATTGVYAHDGQTYNKVTESVNTIKELEIILNWSEEPFDEAWYLDHEFVAGDIEELSKHGVHAEYLPTLQALKAEIAEYIAWAQPKIDAGAGKLTLFSTLNLHIFQTYYGGLRPTADMSSWIYGDYDLVAQFINDGQGLKEWLEDQGAAFIEDTQPTLIGALWYRENEFQPSQGRWGVYFVAPMNTINSNPANKIMTRTTATGLIVEDGKVTGVKATQYDGTEVTVHATKGVVICTGGYAANLDLLVSENVYWSPEYVSTSTKTTNRSSLQGDGILMAQRDANADVTGLGFAQMMPISWIDDGNLAFGGGNYAVYINPTTGKRFVDETSERDVLSLGEFRNGIEMLGSKGVFIEIANLEQPVPGPYLYKAEDVANRQWVRSIEQFAELFAAIGVPTDADTVIETIREYDAAIMAGTETTLPIKKTNANRLIGNAEKDEQGKYIPETYTLEGVALRVRLMSPSTHHTMGGLKVDVARHVLNTNGDVIPGLYAAGEVTGGIHGGNRLGGNAIVEIFVSGRTAAQAITADNK